MDNFQLADDPPTGPIIPGPHTAFEERALTLPGSNWRNWQEPGGSLTPHCIARITSFMMLSRARTRSETR